MLRSIMLTMGLLLAPVSVSAVQIPGLFNTGVDASGNALPLGTVDPHWTFDDGSSLIAVDPNTAAIPNEDDANWLETTVNATTIVELTFDLTGFNSAIASLSGSWAVDNGGEIFLNGQPAIGTGTFLLSDSLNLDAFNQEYAFTITDGFLPGDNVLSIEVFDRGFFAGVFVDDLVMNFAGDPLSVFTPASLLFLMPALAFGRFFRRRPR